MTKTKVLICPYCGETQPAGERCRACAGLFEPLSRQATHNDMGPWFIRDPFRPFQPGCSYETIIKLIERGQITKTSILRGPTTKQFWTIARRAPGVAHLLGYCHSCDAPVDVEDHGCPACGVPFGAYLDRNYLGLPEVRPLPWEPGHDEAAAQTAAVAGRMDLRMAAEPLGISSFASDTELRGGTPAMAFPQARSQSIASAAAAASGFAVNPDVSGLTVTDEAARPTVNPVAALTAASAAQRKLNQQKVVIRWLAVGLMAAAIVAVVALAMLLTSRPTTPPEIAENGAEPTGAAVEEPPVAPVAPEVPLASASEVAAWRARVEELRVIVGQEDRPSEERIEAAEEALRLLREIETKAAPDQQPTDLAAQIAAMEKKLDELRLKSFFP